MERATERERGVKGLIGWAVRRPLRAAGGVLMTVLVAALATCAAQTPRSDRAWFPYLSHTAHVDMQGERFAVAPVIDWSYDARGPSDETLAEAAFDLKALKNVWFVLEPQPGSMLAAHTFLLFEFEGDRLLGVTIEARREANEDYSAVRGAFNVYELSYVWATARDLLTRRAVYLGHELFVYPVAITDEQKRTLITRLLRRTHDLEARPRFYNTLFSNCTNELAKATDLSWHYSFVLTGASDDHLFTIGLIPGASFAEAQARADVADFVKQLNADVSKGGFDAALLAELRRRNGARPAPSPAH
jgi:hypothetical protein